MQLVLDIGILFALSSVLVLEYKWYKGAEEWESENDELFVQSLKEGNENLEKFTRMKNVNIALYKQNCVIAMMTATIAIVIFVSNL